MISLYRCRRLPQQRSDSNEEAMRISQARRKIASYLPALPMRRTEPSCHPLPGISKKRHRMSHSVSRHLNVEIENFDRAIRDFVPGYETMLRVAAEHAAAVRDDGLLLELGAGTGALSEAILSHGSFRAAELIDIDPEVLQQARSRLALHGDKIRFREGSYHGPLTPCSVVVTSLALHPHPDNGSEARTVPAHSRCARPRRLVHQCRRNHVGGSG